MIKGRNCNGCKAYETVGWKTGICGLGFDVIQLGNNATEGVFSRGDRYSVYCRPKEPCSKPKTIKQYIDASKCRGMWGGEVSVGCDNIQL